jgi:hypothetical protein
MAAEDTGVQPEEARQKVIWSYIGKVVLWVSLFLSGLALERLGLTSSVLSGVLPGEVQTLRADISETSKEVSALRQERDTIRIQIGYIAEAPDQLERCLSDIKQIEASLQNSPAADTP